MSILVYVENTEGKFKKSAFEAVSYAKAIAGQLSTNLIALSIGSVAAGDLSELGKYGAEKVLSASSDKLKSFVNEAYASTIAEAAKKTGATIVILSNTFSGKGLAPCVAVKLKAGSVSGAIALPEINGNKFTVKKTAFSSKAFAYVELASENKVVSLATNSYQVTETGQTAQVESFEPQIKDSDLKK